MDLTTEQRTALLKELTNRGDALKALGLVGSDVTPEKAAERIKDLLGLVGDGKGKGVLDEMNAKISAIDKAIAARPLHGLPGAAEEFDHTNRKKQFSLAKALYALQNGGEEKHFKDAKALREYGLLKEYTRVTEEEFSKADQHTGDDPFGGYRVPDQVIPVVIRRMYATSRFLAMNGEGDTRVRLFDGLRGDPVKFAKEFGGFVASWTSEGMNAALSAITSGEGEFRRRKATGALVLTEEQLEFGMRGFDEQLNAAVANGFSQLIDTGIMFGYGGREPVGIIHTPGIRVFSAQAKKPMGVLGGSATHSADINNTTNYQEDWQGGELTYDDIANIFDELYDVEDLGGEAFQSGLNPNLIQTVITNRKFLRRLVSAKVTNFSGQTTDRDYLLGMLPFLTFDRLSALTGIAMVDTPRIPSTRLPGESVGANTTSTTRKFTDVILGGLENIMVGRWGGIELANDGGKGTGFLSGRTYVRARMYMDHHIARTSALALVPDARARD